MHFQDQLHLKNVKNRIFKTPVRAGRFFLNFLAISREFLGRKNRQFLDKISTLKKLRDFSIHWRFIDDVCNYVQNTK